MAKWQSIISLNLLVVGSILTCSHNQDICGVEKDTCGRKEDIGFLAVLKNSCGLKKDEPGCAGLFTV
eukprot:15476166-Alexandrium_andersonii.AAC.1